jgi:hypothetical protein
MASLDRIGAELEQLAPDTQLEDSFTRGWRMSSSQRHRLRALLLRARALRLTPRPDQYRQCGDAGALLDALQSRLDQSSPL